MEKFNQRNFWYQKIFITHDEEFSKTSNNEELNKNYNKSINNVPYTRLYLSFELNKKKFGGILKI